MVWFSAYQSSVNICRWWMKDGRMMKKTINKPMAMLCVKSHPMRVGWLGMWAHRFKILNTWIYLWDVWVNWIIWDSMVHAMTCVFCSSRFCLAKPAIESLAANTSLRELTFDFSIEGKRGLNQTLDLGRRHNSFWKKKEFGRDCDFSKWLQVLTEVG